MISEELFLTEKRKEFLENDIYLDKRIKFIDDLIIGKITDVELNEIETLEMYYYNDGVIKNNIQSPPQFLKHFKFSNTRKKLSTETRAEMDRLPFEKALKLTYEIIFKLIKLNFHFAVFCVEGGRSPHIIIYDFEELKYLSPYQREIAQREFWRSLIPFEFQHLDRSIWQDDHYVPLEFAPHWKHKNPFTLCFENIPKEEERLCNQ
jgi:hypothetical protein